MLCFQSPLVLGIHHHKHTHSQVFIPVNQHLSSSISILKPYRKKMLTNNGLSLLSEIIPCLQLVHALLLLSFWVLCFLSFTVKSFSGQISLQDVMSNQGCRCYPQDTVVLGYIFFKTFKTYIQDTKQNSWNREIFGKIRAAAFKEARISPCLVRHTRITKQTIIKISRSVTGKCPKNT